MKIWLDDVRQAPAGYLHCRSVNEVISAVERYERTVIIEVIDCDHDLGDYASDGGDGIRLLDWLAERGTYYPIELHTANPVGRANMLREINAYWQPREKIMYKNRYFTLSNGVKIPAIGLGTWQTPEGEEAYNSVLWALEAGYRHVDTALVYGNEGSVGRALKDSSLARKEVFITTKLPADVKSYEGALKSFESSLTNLGTDYLDLYLIHAPWPWSAQGSDCTQGNIEAWKAMVKLYNEGRVRAIGVSNFHPADIEAVYNATGVMPMANQIRYFVGNTQPAVSGYCSKNGILVQAYSPLATGELINNPLLNALAEKYARPISAICLAYCLQKGTNPLPKSTHRQRIANNLNVDIILSEEDMGYLDGLHHIASTRKFRD